MPGKRIFAYRFHLVAPDLGIDRKYCTYADIVAHVDPLVKGEFNNKHCWRLTKGAYKRKFKGWTLTKINEPRKFQRTIVFEDE